MRRSTRWSTWAAAGCLAVGGAVTVVVLATGSGDGPQRPPKAVSTLDVQPRTCLLTGADSNGSTSERVWAGIRQAAAQKGGMTVQRFALPTGISAGTYLGTLSQMRCTVIVTVGDDVRAAVRAGGGVRYVVVSARASDVPGVTSLKPDAATPAAVAKAITKTEAAATVSP